MTTLGSGFKNPAGLAVDWSGNLYVADETNNAVKELMLKSLSFFLEPVGPHQRRFRSPLTSPVGTALLQGTDVAPQVIFSPATFAAVGGGFIYPNGIALDLYGDVFVADGNKVLAMPPGCSSSSCVSAIGNNALKVMPAGCKSSACVSTLLTNANGVGPLVLDPSGNVYVGMGSVVKRCRAPLRPRCPSPTLPPARSAATAPGTSLCRTSATRL